MTINSGAISRHTITGLAWDTRYTVRIVARHEPPGTYYIGGDSAWSNDVVRRTVKPALTASEVKQTTATLAISNFTNTWYHKKTNPGIGSWMAESSTSVDLTGLTTDTQYTWAAYSKSACAVNDKIAETTFSTLALIASEITATSAVLTLKNYSDYWTIKQATEVVCELVEENTSHTATNLSPGTSYTFEADVHETPSCNRLLASRTFATLPPKPSTPTITVDNGRLTLVATVGGGAVPLTKWQYVKKAGTNAFETNWTNISATSKTLSHTFTNLTNGTNYQFKVRAVNVSGSSAESDASTATQPAAPTLVASNISASGATLTIGNYIAAWWYKGNQSGATCTSVAANTATATLSSLDAGTSYTYKAYSNNTCGTLLATAAAFLTKPGKTTGVTTTVLDTKLKVAWSAVTSATSYKVQWKSGTQDYNTGNRQKTVTSGSSTTTTITGLTNSTAYTVKVTAYNTTGDGLASDEATGTPADETLTIAAHATDNTKATLTIGNYSGDWYYKYTSLSGGNCSSTAVSTTSVDLSSLLSNTSYTYKAYSNSSCSTELAAASAFLTKPGKASKPTVAAGTGSGKLTLSASVNGSGTLTGWEYIKKEGSSDWETIWSEISSTNTSLSYTVTGLTDATSYQFKVRAKNATGTGAASDASTAIAPADETLTVEAHATDNTKAMLTIGNYSSSWYYKYTTPNGGNCSSTAVSATSVVLSSLSSNTSYTYKAYSDSSCSTELAAASAFLTKPGKPTTPTVAAGTGSGKLTLSASVTGSGTLTGWQYQQKTTGDYGSWQDISSTSTSLSYTVTGLTDATSYQFKVRAKNDTGEGAWSNEVTGTPAATLTLGTVDDQSFDQNNRVSLTLPEASGGNAPLTYSLALTNGTPTLPAGLSFDPATRVLSGTPTEKQSAAEYTYTVEASNGDIAATTFNITVTLTSANLTSSLEAREPLKKSPLHALMN